MKLGERYSINYVLLTLVLSIIHMYIVIDKYLMLSKMSPSSKRSSKCCVLLHIIQKLIPDIILVFHSTNLPQYMFIFQTVM